MITAMRIAIRTITVAAMIIPEVIIVAAAATIAGGVITVTIVEASMTMGTIAVAMIARVTTMEMTQGVETTAAPAGEMIDEIACGVLQSTPQVF
jgi:hypothetical protein